MKRTFDVRAKDYPELEVGQDICLKPNPDWKDQRRCLGRIAENFSDRSYIVEANGKKYRRNRVFLRESDETHPSAEAESPDQRRMKSPEPPVEMPAKEKPPALPTSPVQQSPHNSPYKTRSGRSVKLPGKLRDSP